MSYFDNKMDDLIPELHIEARKYSKNPQLSNFLKTKVAVSKQMRSFSIQPKQQEQSQRQFTSFEFSPQQKNSNFSPNLKKFGSYNPEVFDKKLGQNNFYSPQKQKSIYLEGNQQFYSPTQKLLYLNKLDNTMSTNLPSTQHSNQNIQSQQSTKINQQEKLSPINLNEIRKQRQQQEQMVAKMSQQLHKLNIDNQRIEKLSRLQKQKDFYEWDLKNRKEQDRIQKQKTLEQQQKEQDELAERVQREKFQNKYNIKLAQHNWENKKIDEISQEKEHRFQIKQIGQMNRMVDYSQRRACYNQVTQQHHQLKNQKQHIEDLQKQEAQNNYREKVMKEALKQQELQRNLAYLQMDQEMASQQYLESQMEAQATIQDYYVQTQQGFNTESSSLQEFMKYTSKPSPLSKLKNQGKLKNQDKYSKFVSDPAIMSPILESKKVI